MKIMRKINSERKGQRERDNEKETDRGEPHRRKIQ
jgi:hypothetical protein